MATKIEIPSVLTFGSVKTILTRLCEDVFNPPASPSIELSGLDIDWTLGAVFYKDIRENSTFTFSNVTDGKIVTVIIRNTSLVAVDVTLPDLVKSAALALSVLPGNTNIYTFVRANGKTYVSYVSNMA